MDIDKIMTWVGIIVSICAICICTMCILITFNFIEFDKNDNSIYHIVETREKEIAVEKPYKLTEKDRDIMNKSHDGDKVTIDDKIYIKHICYDGIIVWLDQSKPHYHMF